MIDKTETSKLKLEIAQLREEMAMALSPTDACDLRTATSRACCRIDELQAEVERLRESTDEGIPIIHGESELREVQRQAKMEVLREYDERMKTRPDSHNWADVLDEMIKQAEEEK